MMVWNVFFKFLNSLLTGTCPLGTRKQITNPPPQSYPHPAIQSKTLIDRKDQKHPPKACKTRNSRYQKSSEQQSILEMYFHHHDCSLFYLVLYICIYIYILHIYIYMCVCVIYNIYIYLYSTIQYISIDSPPPTPNSPPVPRFSATRPLLAATTSRQTWRIKGTASQSQTSAPSRAALLRWRMVEDMMDE